MDRRFHSLPGGNASAGPGEANREARIGRVREPEVTTLPGGERVVTDRLRGVRSVALGLWIALSPASVPGLTDPDKDMGPSMGMTP